ncbi:MAG: hypothetical protein M1830_008242 [Pleopsidium flavum]|nr:MAG: hypothetical protein M1830_008242 [Pleopsidium flavum]
MISSIDDRPLPDLPSSASSALTSFIQSSNPIKASQTHDLYYHHLASQVVHNLRYQHDWASLCIHTHSPLPSASSKLLPRPLISGLPPQRIYVHPDEQVELLKQEENKSGEADVSDGHDAEGDGAREREWVLPTHVKEKWSLRRFADVFDEVGDVPPGPEEEGDVHAVQDNMVVNGREEQNGNKEKRRGGKRVLLATANADSTIVYYIVHEGIVKPRQN